MVSNGDMASFGARRDSYPTNEITPMAMEAHTNLTQSVVSLGYIRTDDTHKGFLMNIPAPAPIMAL